MDVRACSDPLELLDLVGPLLRAERVRNTVALTVLDALCRSPLPSGGAPVLLSLHEGRSVVGAAIRTPPHHLISSAVPPGSAETVLDALAEHDPELPGFTGPVAVVDELVAAAGRPAVEEIGLRLFVLGGLVEPAEVPGVARPVLEADVELVAHRLVDFASRPGPRR